MPRSYFALVAAAVFAIVLLAGIGIFMWQSQPLPPTQAELAAHFAKGVPYEHGTGVTLDYGQALTWYRKAAEGNYPPAEHALGLMTEAGRGVVRDEKAANAWFLRAAEHGLPEAQVHLARNLLTGTGTADGKPDKIEALKWLLIGAEAMPDPLTKQVAVTTRENLALELSDEDRTEATRRADEWRDAHAAPR